MIADKPTLGSEAPLQLTSPWPCYREDEIEGASRPLRIGKVNYWTGSEGREFEKEFAAYFGVDRAVAVSNGSVAIELLVIGLGLRPGDEVVVTPRTFLASATSFMLQGLVPVFADVDPDSGNITAETVSKVLSDRTRAVFCVHLGGWPCELDDLQALCTAHNLYLLEDCAQCHGATYRGRYTGSFGVVNAWSFCQDKIMTTAGEGGMVTTNDAEIWSRIWSYKDHGKSWEAVYERSHPEGFRWLHESIGTNWRLTESQSAVGRIQLGKLAGWLAARRRNASLLAEVISQFDGVRVPRPPKHIDAAFYRLYAYVRPENLKTGWSRDRIMTTISREGVPCFVGSCSEIYLEKAFEGYAKRPVKRLEVASELGETSLCFQVHPTLTEPQIRAQGEIISRVLAEATR